MILDKALLIKGLGGLTACAGLACTGTYIVRPDLFESNDQTLVDLISKVGLTGCTNVNKECTIKTEGISVKQGENKETSKTKQTGSGKIKVYKLEGDNTGYNKGFKFVIEDGDITLTGGSGSTTISKLEQFETYEIKEETEGTTKKWYFSRKKKAGENIKESLGLPSDCTLPTSDSDSSSCSEKVIDETKLKAINFEGKNASGTVTFPTNKNVKLTVTKTSDSPFTDGGYKFKFTSDGDITIPKTGNGGNITIKTNTNTEFKIKKSGSSLSLEKAWTVATLAKQVGLTNCDASTKTCDLPSSSLNVEFSSNDKSSVTISSGSQSKKLKYEENAAEHNQGFKFFTENEIALSADSKKIEASTAATYEIKKNNSDSKWYLTKKAVTNGGAGG